jgi:hypothetical protein
MNDELEITLKEEVVAYPKILTRNSYGGNEENCEKLNSG